MKLYWQRLLKYITVVEIAVFATSLVLFLMNHRYFAYPDEFVNLLGGLSILHGGLPYKDFFDHHLPFAWGFSAILLLFSFKSYVYFRLLWCLSVFSGFVILARYFKKSYPTFLPIFYTFMILYPIMSLYYWFHLFVADSLAIFFFSLVFWLLLAQTITKKVSFKALSVASVLTACLIFSSLTYIYLAMILYAWQLLLVWNFKSIKKAAMLIGIMAIPYLIFALYLLVTWTWYDFYVSNFVYNTKLYIDIPNYTKGRFFNPIKFSMTIIYNFFSGYIPLLSKIKYFDLYLPLPVVAALGSMVLTIILFGRNALFGILFFFALTFSAPRSNIQVVNEGDYQASLFIVFGTISALVALYTLYEDKHKNILVEDLKRIAGVIMAIFLIFSAIFLFTNAYSKYYLRYTQKMPSINDRSDAAAFIDTTLNKGDYYWIGPYEPDTQFFVKKAKLPGKYVSLLTSFREDDYFKNDFLKQFETNPPKIIIYRQEASMFGTPSLEFGKFFLDWMKGKYTSIEHIEGLETSGSPTQFNFRTDLFIRNDVQSEILPKLREQGYLK